MDIDLARLCTSMQHARLVLRKPREERVRFTRAYVGSHWSEEGSEKDRPINLIGTYCSIVGRKLIANNPRVLLSTAVKKAKPVVNAMGEWCNREIEHMDLANTLQRVVLDALFSIGICKVGLATPEDASVYSWNLKAGEPFAQRVDLDDFVYDIHARDFSECSFMGHRYRVPLSVVKKSKLYSKSRKDLTASEDPLYNMSGDERISVLGRTTISAGDTQEFEDMVDLWEVYLPRHRLVITLHDDHLSGAGLTDRDARYDKALRIQNWLGPDTGPYHILGFGVVPGNPMPKAPLQDLFDLDHSINVILRKLIRQAENQKSNTFVRGGHTEDGERIMKANDLDILRVDNPESVSQVVGNGPHQGNFQLFASLKELFSWLAGNLEIAGGLGPQSKTATQDEMLQAASSATIGDMQEKVVKHTASIIKGLCWYWHHDPQRVMKSTFSLPGMPELQAIRRVHPAGQSLRPDGSRRLARDHAFEDMDIRVDPYALQYQTPQQRESALDQLVTKVLTPLMPILQQQGVAFDANAYLVKKAKYRDDPDLPDIVSLREPPQEDGGGSSPEGGTMPASTTRNYTRRSEGGATSYGNDLTRANKMNGTPQAMATQ